MRLINLALRLGAHHISNTVVELEDGSLVNFVYEPNGLRSFSREYRDAPAIAWLGQRVKVLPLERIRASKQAAGRPKDMAHLPLIDAVLAASRISTRSSGARRPRAR